MQLDVCDELLLSSVEVDQWYLAWCYVRLHCDCSCGSCDCACCDVIMNKPCRLRNHKLMKPINFIVLSRSDDNITVALECDAGKVNIALSSRSGLCIWR